jgi:hypothetical protein
MDFRERLVIKLKIIMIQIMVDSDQNVPEQNQVFISKTDIRIKIMLADKCGIDVIPERKGTGQ